jgi:hypothetical protein
MQVSQIPVKFPIPWANSASSGYIRSVPVASQIGIQAGAASLTDGFPPLTFIQETAGGVPPFGQDTNGILNQITAWIQWQNAGALVSYDSAFSTAIGGYPKGAILVSAASPDAWWVSTADNNTSDPDTGGANWILVSPPITFAGNPNGYVGGLAGVAGGQSPTRVWDSLHQIWWTCVTSGAAGTAVFVPPPNSVQQVYCGISAGTANSQTLTPPNGLQAFSAGTEISWIAGAGLTNTGALTVSVTGFGSFPTRKETLGGLSALTGGEVRAGNAIKGFFDGTYIQILNPAQGSAASANASSATGTVAAVSGAGSIVSGNFLSAADANGTAEDSGFSPGSINSIGFTTLYMNGELF